MNVIVGDTLKLNPASCSLIFTVSKKGKKLFGNLFTASKSTVWMLNFLPLSIKVKNLQLKSNLKVILKRGSYYLGINSAQA